MLAPRRLAVAALVTTFVLNVQGTFLRATGSGDGCGTSWPTCNGEVIPLDPEFATALEFGHRLLTVLVGVIGLALLTAAIRHRRLHPGLLPAVGVAAFFFVAQALVGAFTVMAGLTGDSTDPLRAIILPTHLVNSFTQLGALALAVLYAGPRPPGRWQVRDRLGAAGWLLASTIGFYLLVFTGGIAALGDLFVPAETLRAGVIADFSADSPWPVRVRVIHPVLGAVVGTFLLLAAAAVPLALRERPVRRAAAALGGVYVVQLGVGTWNLLALAPIPLQMVHQSLAMTAFGLFVVLVATTLTARTGRRADHTHLLQDRPDGPQVTTSR